MSEKDLVLKLNKWFFQITFGFIKQHRSRLFTIIKIIELSNMPGQTKFSILDVQKKTISWLTADQLISQSYDLLGFNNFHASLIGHAVAGTIYEFLNIEDALPENWIKSKVFDSDNLEYRFTIKNKSGKCSIKTAKEISQNKLLLSSLSFNDIYDVAYIEGSERMIKEKIDLLLAKSLNLPEKKASKKIKII